MSDTIVPAGRNKCSQNSQFGGSQAWDWHLCFRTTYCTLSITLWYDGPNSSERQRPAWLPLQLKKGIVPWRGQQEGDPIWHINSALGTCGKWLQKMELVPRKEALDPYNIDFLSFPSFQIQMQVKVSSLVLRGNKDRSVQVQICV